jgi:hypothetical protein
VGLLLKLKYAKCKRNKLEPEVLSNYDLNFVNRSANSDAKEIFVNKVFAFFFF